MKGVRCFGTSMYPFIKNGEIVLYCEDVVGFKRGDMIVYALGDKIYIHRIVSIDGERFIVSNDDDIERHVIKREQILGRVLSRYNGAFGYILHFVLRYIRMVKKFFYGYN